MQEEVGRRWHRLLLGLAAVLALFVLSLPAAAADFPRPDSLEPAVGFWRSIFATFSRNQVVLHDNRHLGVVYEVLDFRSLAGPNGLLDAKASRRKKKEVERAEKRIEAALQRLHRYEGRPPQMTLLEARVRDRSSRLTGKNKFADAAKRVRSQSGLRERFSSGLIRQRAYRAEMEAMFAARGLPVALAHMPLVESCFDVDAYSKVGAAGVWQFMPRTGRQYLKINSALDERRDPLRSTEAAAEHLRRDYEALGSWPLAITAYNHGRGGMQKAMRKYGSDFESMVHEYRGRRFGFASRNFYVEFLAAIDVVRDAERHFGALRQLEVPRSREVRLRRSMRLTDAAKHVGVTRDDLIALNPAFLRRVRYGVDRIPRGYRLRVPKGPRDPALARARRNSGRDISARNEPRIVVHKVGRGQTLGGIARRYGASVREIQKMNGVRNPRRIQIGQELMVPLG
ncbi:MAG: transglycosylase SLT domain-containing protein [Deltaproteobacteria bacterium]